MPSSGVQPSHRHTMQVEASQHCIQLSISISKGDCHMPPLKHQCSKPLVKDFIQPWIDMPIADVILTMPWEVIVLFEKKSVHRDLSYEVADELVCGLPCMALWVNTIVDMVRRVISLIWTAIMKKQMELLSSRTP